MATSLYLDVGMKVSLRWFTSNLSINIFINRVKVYLKPPSLKPPYVNCHVCHVMKVHAMNNELIQEILLKIWSFSCSVKPIKQKPLAIVILLNNEFY